MPGSPKIRNPAGGPQLVLPGRGDLAHTQPSPFPRDGVIDEDCTCGHCRSDHFDTIAWGHGPCSICGDCLKFTWAALVTQ